MFLQQFLLTAKATNYSPARVEAWIPSFVPFLRELRKEGATNLKSNESGIYCEFPRPTYNWIESKKVTKPNKRNTVPVIVDCMLEEKPYLFVAIFSQGRVFYFDYYQTPVTCSLKENLGNLLEQKKIQVSRNVALELDLLDSMEIFKQHNYSLEDYIYQKTGRKLLDGLWEKV